MTFLSSHGIFPEGRLAYLIRAALDQQRAAEHWEEYVRQTRHGFPNEGEFRLFPMVQCSLGAAGGSASNQSWLEKASQDSAENTKLMADHKAIVADALTAAGLQVVWTKGTALRQLAYEAETCRPTGDLDAICNWEDLPKIAELAERLEWEKHIGLSTFDTKARHLNTEFSFRLGPRREVDFQWAPRMPYTFDPEMYEYIREHASPCKTSGQMIAPPTWLFLETIEHGLNANAVWPIRWVVDAVKLVRSCGDLIDWDRVSYFSKKYEIQHLMNVGIEAIRSLCPEYPLPKALTFSSGAKMKLQQDELRAHISAPDLDRAYAVNRRYNILLRAPDTVYLRYAPSPLVRGRLFTPRFRLAVALRNFKTRLQQMA